MSSRPNHEHAKLPRVFGNGTDTEHCAELCARSRGDPYPVYVVSSTAPAMHATARTRVLRPAAIAPPAWSTGPGAASAARTAKISGARPRQGQYCPQLRDARQGDHMQPPEGEDAVATQNC